MPWTPIFRLVTLLLIPVLAGACGVGAVQESTFVYGTMDADGGTVSIEEVTLEIPAGALAGPTTIAIIPEVNPLAIQPPLQDPCEYAVLGPQYCCGPVGLDLLEDGRLVVSYDPELIPEGTTEDDLVLLLWDEALSALVPVNGVAAHDPAANLFVVDTYAELGHLAVGYSTCQDPGIVLLGINPAQFLSAEKQGGGAASTIAPSGLWLVSIDGSVEAAQLPTDDVVPYSFLPSPDGRTVLYEFIDFQGESFGSELYSVGVIAGVPTLLAGDDESINGSGATIGWMRDGSRVFFPEEILPSIPPLQADIATVTSFSTVPGDGSAAPTSLYELGPFAYPDDVRQSLDGNLVMVSYFGQFEEQVVDVFDSVTGAPVSQGVIPFGGGQSSPRFLPDSSGLYLVEEEESEDVRRYDPDGSNEAILFTPPSDHGFLKDFVLAPNGDDYAYIGFSFLANQKPNQITIPNVDILYVGSLSGGLRGSFNLGSNAFFNELIFHPDGQHVFLDTFQTDVRMFAASDAAAGPDLGVADISELDINADDGRLLLVVRALQDISALTGDASTQGAASPGLYVADPDGQNQQLVTIPAGLDARSARWLRTVRRAPCMGGSACFR